MWLQLETKYKAWRKSGGQFNVGKKQKKPKRLTFYQLPWPPEPPLVTGATDDIVVPAAENTVMSDDPTAYQDVGHVYGTRCVRLDTVLLYLRVPAYVCN